MASNIFKRHEINNLAKIILAKNPGIIALQGPLGAGKTTLTKEIARILDITDNVISPTYVLETEYKIPNSDKLFIHIDCYRMESVEELMRLGIESRIKHGDVIVIEWATKFKSQIQNLKSQIVWIDIALGEKEDERIILIDLISN